MKACLIFMLLSFFNLPVPGWSATNLPAGALGILSIDSMTQGQMLWLKGRVGEASYQYRGPDNRQCTLNVPVAVGRIADADVGVSTVPGLQILVLSAQLSQALLAGERIKSDDWHFSRAQGGDNVDGLILQGIAPDEGFVLNSRRRWISWLRGDNRTPVCL
ncbi:hypothetical protein ACKC9G_15245 [Pokkaliibacter sp. CJK22405]|uniref:hypothetical protein n=1 Tax=Pokkaliibacter sp. CJK22405 TaxID=3384615 RepID=UPI0039851615